MSDDYNKPCKIRVASANVAVCFQKKPLSKDSKFYRDETKNDFEIDIAFEMRGGEIILQSVLPEELIGGEDIINKCFKEYINEDGLYLETLVCWSVFGPYQKNFRVFSKNKLLNDPLMDAKLSIARMLAG